MPLTNYTRQVVVNHVFRNVAVPSPAKVYLALHTGITTDAGGGAEMNGGGYARQQVTFGAPDVTGAAASNLGINFTNLPAGTVVCVALWDSAVGGNMLVHEVLVNAETIASGAPLAIAAGVITLDIDLAA